MKLIDTIKVEKLFGLYTYSIPQVGSLTNASILYGENGLGKSTVLRLAFHLLSAAEDRGHRTALYKVPFQSIQVKLGSGVTLTAKRESHDDSEGVLHLEVFDESNIPVAEWRYRPRDADRAELLQSEFELGIGPDGNPIFKRRRVKSSSAAIPSGEKPYLEALRQYAPVVFILNADRRLDSDRVADPSDEVELRRVMRHEDMKRIHDLVARSREIALSQAMGAAYRWLSQKAFIGANQGTLNVHGVYVAVLHHLMSPQGGQANADAGDPAALASKLSSIENRSAEFARYELATKIQANDFKRALTNRAPRKRELAANLLKPYIDSLEGRLEGQKEIYEIVHRFVSTVNDFLSDKKLSFSLTGGFVVTNKLGNVLKPHQLSSGEQQLLLLFCNVLTSRDIPSVFMIDEPEISLNIKWQRRLVQSLLDITSGSNTQFIFASHSLELLAQHRHRVVRLGAGHA